MFSPAATSWEPTNRTAPTNSSRSSRHASRNATRLRRTSLLVVTAKKTISPMTTTKPKKPMPGARHTFNRPNPPRHRIDTGRRSRTNGLQYILEPLAGEILERATFYGSNAGVVLRRGGFNHLAHSCHVGRLVYRIGRPCRPRLFPNFFPERRNRHDRQVCQLF